MPYPYITEAELRNKVGSALVDRVLDDDNVGPAKPAAVVQLIADGCSRVRSRLKTKLTDGQVSALESDTPPEVKRLSLKICEVELLSRYPEVWPSKDWREYEKSWRQDLDDWATGMISVEDEYSPQEASVFSEDLRGF